MLLSQSRPRVLVSFLFALAALAPLRSSAVLAEQPVPLHVLKIAAGPAGEPSNGRFVLAEERTVFSRTDDKEVIVSFEWEGAPGQHKLVAQWRSQDGGATSSSVVDYTAKTRRFGAYWSLPMSSSVPLGTWSIEATVDGQPGGRLTFEVTDRKPEPGKPAVVAKQPLGQSELYERLRQVFVRIDRFSSAGRTLDPVSGVLGNGRVYTSMAAVDDVERLRAVVPGGTAQDLTTLLGWNRENVELKIKAEDLARIVGTLSYEVTCGVSERVPRVYV